MKVRILLGQTVRSGTNYVGSLMHTHPNVVNVPPEYSRGEFNLFSTNKVIEHFNKVCETSFSLGVTGSDLDDFLPMYGQAWLLFFLRKFKISLSSSQYIFLKSPSLENWELWSKTFPHAKIAIIVRDGRDNVESCVRAANDKRPWHTMKIRLKKRINFYSGRSFLLFSKNWARTARLVHFIINTDSRFRMFRYEDLLCEHGIEQLLRFYELPVSREIVSSLKQAPVVGSSWGVRDKHINKPNWEPITDKSKFTFIGKWENWSLVKRVIFTKIAGSEMNLLNYDMSNF